MPMPKRTETEMSLQLKLGSVFGRWTIIKECESAYRLRNGKKSLLRRVTCKCSCGTVREVDAHSLLCGGTKGCGCVTWKHGKSHASEYQVWASMKERCNNQKAPNFHRYGGRGIKVCDRWNGTDGFKNFYADMGQRPSMQHTLDRIDNDGDYEPSNCRWATKKEQSRNSCQNRLLTCNGKTMCLASWVEETGISNRAIRERLKKGWTVEEALTIRPRGENGKY